MRISAARSCIVQASAYCGLALTMAATNMLVGAESWSAFQNGGALRTSSGGPPLRWSPDAGIAWTRQLAGYGQSSPVVCDDVVYVTSMAGAMKEELHVEALDLQTGERLWHFAAKNSSPEESTGYVSKAAPTPVCDSDGVIALFEGGNVMALTREGQLRWQRDLVAEFGPITSRHGLASSLEQDATHVFLWIERQEQPYLMALAKSTGETKWKVEGLGATTWSSPRLVPTAEGNQLVCSASGTLAGLDPHSGKRLWEFTDIANNTTCTPFPYGKSQFLIGASEGRGEETSNNAAASNGMLQIAKQDDGTYKASFSWRAKKATSSFGSPIVVAGKAFFVNRAGVLYQLDAETGEELSATRVGSGSIWATPCVIGNYLYLFGNRGTTSVISLSDGHEVVQNRLWTEQAQEGDTPSAENVLYAAAVVPHYLLLRRGEAVFAVLTQPDVP